jgi:hypothetical protein
MRINPAKINRDATTLKRLRGSPALDGVRFCIGIYHTLDLVQLSRCRLWSHCHAAQLAFNMTLYWGILILPSLLVNFPPYFKLKFGILASISPMD